MKGGRKQATTVGRSCCKAIDTREIDLGAQSFVDVVGEGVQRDMGDDLENFRIAVTGGADLFDFAGCYRAASVDKAAAAFGSFEVPRRFASISLSSSSANFVPV